MWHLGEREPALERLLHALRLNPEYDWAWDTLRQWSSELDRPQLPLELARELTEVRGGEAAELAAPGPVPGRARSTGGAARRAGSGHRAGPGGLLGARPPGAGPGGGGPMGRGRGGVPAAGLGRSSADPAAGPVPPGSWPPGATSSPRWSGCGPSSPIVPITTGAGTTWSNGPPKGRAPPSTSRPAEALSRLDGNDPVAAGYLGDARARTGDRAGAKDAFRRGFDRAPGHAYTASRLFDMELEDEQLDAASCVLESLKTHHDGPLVIAREVQLARARGDREGAAAALERLCITPPGGTDWPLSAADRAFTDAGWGRDAEAIYARALDHPDVVPRVARPLGRALHGPSRLGMRPTNSTACWNGAKSDAPPWRPTWPRRAGPGRRAGSPPACADIARSSARTRDAGEPPGMR